MTEIGTAYQDCQGGKSAVKRLSQGHNHHALKLGHDAQHPFNNRLKRCD